MADNPKELNGCYLLLFDGTKYPIARSLALALQRIISEQKNKTGNFTVHVKNGGVSAVSVNTLFME